MKEGNSSVKSITYLQIISVSIVIAGLGDGMLEPIGVRIVIVDWWLSAVCAGMKRTMHRHTIDNTTVQHVMKSISLHATAAVKLYMRMMFHFIVAIIRTVGNVL